MKHRPVKAVRFLLLHYTKPYLCSIHI